MKLEVGKFYKTRDGRKAEVVYINEEWTEYERAIIKFEGKGYGHTYSLNGTYYPGGGACNNNLIEEWKEPIKYSVECYVNLTHVKLFDSLVGHLCIKEWNPSSGTPLDHKVRITIEEIE